MSCIYLASGSPRRRELIGLLNYQCDILRPSVIEEWGFGETPQQYVQKISYRKITGRSGYCAL